MSISPVPGQGHPDGLTTTPSPATGAPQAHHAGHAPQAIPHPQPPQSPHPPQTPAPGAGALLGLRSAIILMLGVLVGTGTGVLTYLAQHDAATAVLAGGAAFAGAVLFFHTIIAA
ncbi:hypothetical protein ACFZAG_41410 [Streptomyces sp. NPDC012403]|uniref:hypothetical protein n=1 Tax=Streptomyces sp. NPDC012403 TaxID=3364831 RepID=UPI0036E8663F